MKQNLISAYRVSGFFISHPFIKHSYLVTTPYGQKQKFQPLLRYHGCHTNDCGRSYLQNHICPSISYSTSSFKSGSFNLYKLWKFLNQWHDIETLKIEWDPDFSITDFTTGAKQALCTTISLMQEGSWNSLRGLIVLPLLEQLQSNEAFLNQVKSISRITMDSITDINIKNVSLIKIVEHKYCDIDIIYHVKNSYPEEDKLSDIPSAVDIITLSVRFHREYTRGKLPEWTITRLAIISDGS